MKKVLLSLSVLSVFLIISCGSKPAAEEPKPEPPVIEETEQEQTKEDVVTDTESVDNSQLLAKIDDARNAAIEAGAEEKAKDLLDQLDELYNQLKNSDADISSDANDLIAKYQALANYIKAKEVKQKVDDNDLASYSQKDYDEAEKNLAVVEGAYSNNEPLTKQVFDSAEKAYAGYNSVLIIAYKKLAKAERELAYLAKKDADSVKAGVSQKEKYQQSAQKIQNGDSLYSMQSPEKAYYNYKEAKEEFTALYQDVSEKRAAAAAAIEAAKKRVAESENFAIQADTDAPISSDEQIEGIEEEDAVLLEEDNYDAPEDAEIEIAETIDDSGDDSEEFNATVETDAETPAEEM